MLQALARGSKVFCLKKLSKLPVINAASMKSVPSKPAAVPACLANGARVLAWQTGKLMPCANMIKNMGRITVRECIKLNETADKKMSAANIPILVPIFKVVFASMRLSIFWQHNAPSQ